MLLIIRIVLVLSYFFLVALLGAIACLFRPFNPDNTRICGRMFGWGALRLMGVKLVIENADGLHDRQPGVVIANHQSNLDLFVHGSIIPSRTVSIGKKSLKYLPFFGQVYWLAGNIMIDRQRSKESIDVMTQVTEAIQQRNTSIWFFPEGTRNGGNNLLPFKKGAFHMATNAQAPVLPICASSYPKHLKLNRWHAGEVYVHVLPEMYAQDYDSLAEFVEAAHQRMKSEIERLDQKASKA